MSLASEGDVSRSQGFVIRLLSGYYKWCRNTTGLLMAAQEVALVEIKAIHAEVKERYGSPRIHRGYDPEYRSSSLGFRLLAVLVGG
jgi:hypothetical protein